jgi:CheY-like chemotaxis protein
VNDIPQEQFSDWSPPPAFVGLDSLRVLVVDDEPAIGKLLRMMLNDLGVGEVALASDGAEALQFIGEHEGRINTVISDWNMPKMTGIELLRQIRTVDARIQFLMITGRPTAEAVMEARSLGITAFIAKPFEPELIREKLHAVVAGAVVPKAMPQPRSQPEPAAPKRLEGGQALRMLANRWS